MNSTFYIGWAVAVVVGFAWGLLYSDIRRTRIEMRQLEKRLDDLMLASADERARERIMAELFDREIEERIFEPSPFPSPTPYQPVPYIAPTPYQPAPTDNSGSWNDSRTYTYYSDGVVRDGDTFSLGDLTISMTSGEIKTGYEKACEQIQTWVDEGRIGEEWISWKNL